MVEIKRTFKGHVLHLAALYSRKRLMAAAFSAATNQRQAFPEGLQPAALQPPALSSLANPTPNNLTAIQPSSSVTWSEVVRSSKHYHAQSLLTPDHANCFLIHGLTTRRHHHPLLPRYIDVRTSYSRVNNSIAPFRMDNYSLRKA